MNHSRAGLLTVFTICVSLGCFVACAEDAQTQDNTRSKPMHIDDQVAEAKQDLAERLNVASSSIKEHTVRIVQWKSGARGCPDPNMSYTMVIVPGALIVFAVGDDVHRYHSGRDGVPFYCPADRAEAPAMGPGEEVM